METQKRPDLLVTRNQEIATMTLDQFLVMAALDSAAGLIKDEVKTNLTNGETNEIQ